MYIHLLSIVFILLQSTDLSRSADAHWDYRSMGPDVWRDSFPACAGNSQSPINILSACTIYQQFEPFHFSEAYDITQDFILTNNGHTIVGQQVNKSAYPLTLTGGGLTEPFTFVNFHLHWGENYASGSEHQINGQKYAAEIHVVHANAASNLYAALGVFVQTGSSNASSEMGSDTHQQGKRRRRRDTSDVDNTTLVEWDNYFRTGAVLNETNDSITVSLKLSVLLGKNLDNFYRYSGSLTTPPCTESVIWTMFEKPITIEAPMLDTFRSNVYFEDYRGPQPLNGRNVYRNYINATPSSISDYNCCKKSNENPAIQFSILINNFSHILQFFL